VAEYVPFLDEDNITRKASATITGGQMVYISGDGTVAPTTGAVANWLGMAGFDAAVGDNVTIHTEDFPKATASGAITAGDALETAAAGKLAKHTLGTNDYLVVGYALNTVADGGTVRLKSIR